MGKKGVLIVSCNIEPSKEKEFNEFYNGQHLDVALKIPGYLTGQRYQIFEDADLASAVPGAPPDTLFSGKKRKFIAIYDVDCEEAIAGVKSSPEAATSVKEFFEWVPYLKDVSVTFYEAISDKKVRKAGAGGAA
jgi:hypothetical protein